MQREVACLATTQGGDQWNLHPLVNRAASSAGGRPPLVTRALPHREGFVIDTAWTSFALPERVERQAVLEHAQQVRRAIVAIVGVARLHGIGDQQGADRLGRVRRGLWVTRTKPSSLYAFDPCTGPQLLLQPRVATTAPTRHARRRRRARAAADAWLKEQLDPLLASKAYKDDGGPA